MRSTSASIIGAGIIVWLGVSGAVGAPSPTGARFNSKWNQLIGEWRSENGSGGGSGSCGFHFDLSEHVMVRTNFAQLPNSTVPHSDLMVIYPDAAPDKAKAVYFDNEGHVIDYVAEWASDGNTLTFISKPAPGPRFRLIYKKDTAEVMTVSFEMAMPGQGDVFKPYTSGKIRRTGEK